MKYVLLFLLLLSLISAAIAVFEAYLMEKEYKDVMKNLQDEDSKDDS